MKYYSDRVTFMLAVKLKESGFSQRNYPKYIVESGTMQGRIYKPGNLSIHLDIVDEVVTKVGGSSAYAPTYAEVLDWLIEKGLSIAMFDSVHGWTPYIYRKATDYDYYPKNPFPTFHKAIEYAIEKSLELIKEENI